MLTYMYRLCIMADTEADADNIVSDILADFGPGVYVEELGGE